MQFGVLPFVGRWVQKRRLLKKLGFLFMCNLCCLLVATLTSSLSPWPFNLMDDKPSPRFHLLLQTEITLSMLWEMALSSPTFSHHQAYNLFPPSIHSWLRNKVFDI